MPSSEAKQENKLPLLLVLLLFGGRQVSRYWTDKPVSTCPADQPLVWTRREALGPADLAGLKESLHELMPSLQGQYLGAGFDKTRGARAANLRRACLSVFLARVLG